MTNKTWSIIAENHLHESATIEPATLHALSNRHCLAITKNGFRITLCHGERFVVEQNLYVAKNSEEPATITYGTTAASIVLNSNLAFSNLLHLVQQIPRRFTYVVTLFAFIITIIWANRNISNCAEAPEAPQLPHEMRAVLAFLDTSLRKPTPINMSILPPTTSKPKSSSTPENAIAKLQHRRATKQKPRNNGHTATSTISKSNDLDVQRFLSQERK
jgi:hypothetical protein